MKTVLFLFSLVLVLKCGNFVAIPAYLIPCHKADYGCMTDHGNSLIRSVLKGDKAYGVPSLDPLSLPSVQFTGGQSLLKLIDLKIIGLDQIQFKSIKIDTDKQSGVIDLILPKLIFEGKYEITGKLAVFDLNGAGHEKIVLTDPTGHWEFEYQIKDGYAKISKSDYKFTMSKMNVQFDEIFKNDATLTANVNAAINDNWEATLEEFGPGIEATIKTLVEHIFTGYLDKIPIEELILL